jgi:cell division inhibitor SepF
MDRRVRTEISVVQRNVQDGFARQDNYAPFDEDEYAPRDDSEVYREDGPPDGQWAAEGGVQIAVVRPRNFRDAAAVGEYFRQEIPVVISLEDMPNAEAARIVDFASGLVLGLGGDIERLSRRTFLITPAGASILTEYAGLADSDFFNQALSEQRRLPAVVHEQAVLSKSCAV